jgi:hypothetical protein
MEERLRLCACLQFVRVFTVWSAFLTICVCVVALACAFTVVRWRYCACLHWRVHVYNCVRVTARVYTVRVHVYSCVRVNVRVYSCVVALVARLRARVVCAALCAFAL